MGEHYCKMCSQKWCLMAGGAEAHGASGKSSMFLLHIPWKWGWENGGDRHTRATPNCRLQRCTCTFLIALIYSPIVSKRRARIGRRFLASFSTRVAAQNSRALSWTACLRSSWLVPWANYASRRPFSPFYLALLFLMRLLNGEKTPDTSERSLWIYLSYAMSVHTLRSAYNTFVCSF